MKTFYHPAISVPVDGAFTLPWKFSVGPTPGGWYLKLDKGLELLTEIVGEPYAPGEGSGSPLSFMVVPHQLGVLKAYVEWRKHETSEPLYRHSFEIEVVERDYSQSMRTLG